MLRTQIEPRAAICFFALKGMKAKNIHTKLESAYVPEVLALPALKKWRRHFQERSIDLFRDRRSGRSLTNDLCKAIGSAFAENRSIPASCFAHFRIGKTTCLPILHNKLV
jgi:hypothetical protein